MPIYNGNDSILSIIHADDEPMMSMYNGTDQILMNGYKLTTGEQASNIGVVSSGGIGTSIPDKWGSDELLWQIADLYNPPFGDPASFFMAFSGPENPSLFSKMMVKDYLTGAVLIYKPVSYFTYDYSGAPGDEYNRFGGPNLAYIGFITGRQYMAYFWP